MYKSFGQEKKTKFTATLLRRFKRVYISTEFFIKKNLKLVEDDFFFKNLIEIGSVVAESM